MIPNGLRNSREYRDRQEDARTQVSPLADEQKLPYGRASGDASTIDNQNLQITPQNIDNLLSAMSADTQQYIASRDNPIMTQHPDAIYGYGFRPRDFYSPYETPIERPEGYSAVYDFIEDEGLTDWLDQYSLSGAEEDAVSRGLQILQNQRDAQRDQNLQQMASDMRNRQLYGDTLMELMAEKQQAQQDARDQDLVRQSVQELKRQQSMENRPRARERVF